MVFEIATFGWIVGSILSSTVIIITNKHVMDNFGFTSITLLTAYHFFLTWGLLEVMCRLGAFERGTSMPAFEKWKMGSIGVGAVVFMNFNLQLNSVGFYQLSKLCCIPFMVVYDYLVQGKTTSFPILLSLGILLVGIGIFSINDIQFNILGSIIAFIAVCCVSLFQIYTGSKQKEFTLSPLQLQHTTAYPQFVVALIVGFLLESWGPNAIFNQDLTIRTIPVILSTGLIAVSVNICSFFLIGKTSAITYQVCGHMKSILIFIFGILFFRNQNETREQFIKKIIGLCVSMFGCIWYTYLKLTAAPPAPSKNDKDNDQEGLLAAKSQAEINSNGSEETKN
ncbi:integral membrane protein, putative [Trichomonas vaginalis G3]|uniref:Integral membrane protein, putative n=1 Tax=Trichomonas vaginalis (strain ATCC PRA-98 / G3) TaxID=412133 RepID=A2G1S9_TRIV3|nr:carbohydrate transport [Trichomonas vaginalis G3]EAX88880.1 integral membrane protein, putative [Trichomonas vaginalis G3]KAI5508544.1 carbohydrate transport [Trichomonas vaginalis G3]|eukprot:XP_001301810.1 integral membrane protein [Trichomonas vaginalis G3]